MADRRGARRAGILVAALLGLVVLLSLLPVTAGGDSAGRRAARPPDPVAPAPEPAARAGPVPDLFDRPPGTVPVRGDDGGGQDLSWALLDTASGRWTGSADAGADRTEAESTIKAWLAADTLRAAAEEGRGPTDGEREAISAAVRDSDDDAAERLYLRLGADDSVARLADECDVDVSTARPGWWSYTRVTAVDAARILACVRDRAPGWPGGADLLADLAAVAPEGRSGIAPTLPGQVAEKNGWTLHGDRWTVNCVLAWEDRALAVLLSYPAGRGVEHGWATCRAVAADVLAAAG